MEQYKTVPQLNNAIKKLKEEGYKAKSGKFRGKYYYEDYDGNRVLMDVEKRTLEYVHASEVHL